MYYKRCFATKIIFSLLFLNIVCFSYEIIASQTWNISDYPSNKFYFDSSASSSLFSIPNQTTRSTDLSSTSDPKIIPSTLPFEIYNRTCTSDIECEELIHGKCLNFRCKCDYGYGYLSHFICTDFHNFSCKYDSQCYDADSNRNCDFETSSDTSRSCVCKYDFIEDVSIKKCVQKVGLGQLCIANGQCRTQNSLCNYHNKIKSCTCEPRYKPNYDDCQRKKCEINNDCRSVNFPFDDNFNCNEGLCDCDLGYKMNLTSRKCVYDPKPTDGPYIRLMSDNNNSKAFLYFIFIIPAAIILIYIRYKCAQYSNNSIVEQNQRRSQNRRQNRNRRGIAFVNQTSRITTTNDDSNYSQIYSVSQSVPPVPFNTQSSVPSYEDVTAFDSRPPGADVYSIETAYASWPNYDPKDNQIIEDPPPTYEVAVASIPIDHTNSHHL